MSSRHAYRRSDLTLHISTLAPMCEDVQEIHCDPIFKDSNAQSILGLISYSHGMHSTTGAGMTSRTWQVTGVDACGMRSPLSSYNCRCSVAAWAVRTTDRSASVTLKVASVTLVTPNF